MKRETAAAILSLVLGASASAAPLRPGLYCSREHLEAGPGEDLGVFRADAEIRQTGAGLTLSFTDAMPDSGQELETGRVLLTPGPGDKLTFRFTDNWGAEAGGWVRATRAGLHMDIDRTTEAGDGPRDNAGRNYGAFDLKRGRCPAAPHRR